MILRSRFIPGLAFFLFPLLCFCQDCTLSVSGYVMDTGTETPLQDVNVYVEGNEQGTITNQEGFFEIENLCSGHYHFIISHVGCEPKILYLNIAQDTILQVNMDHSVNILDGLVVTGQASSNSTQNTQGVNEQNISDNVNQNLSNLLESISGVSTIKNGSGISKPMVHGLYGNRLTILNNGVSQSGQQWGNDHSPEIDPLVANKIRVIKGVSALEYAGSNLGSVILVEPKKINREPHLHGKSSYFFESNGFGNGVNLQLEQYHSKLAWKINGTLKKSGDKKAPNYYLRNTGNQEANFALQLERSFSDNLHTDLYFSSFNTDLGVLRGSHVGNLTDLEEAFIRTVPFFTEEDFSYRLEAPKQKVNHQLLKIHSKYFLEDHQWFDFTFASQINTRKEFDVRRNDRTDIPALSLQQFSHFLEGKYQHEFENQTKLKTGLQFNFIDNANNPETGILPLIPDYLSYETSAFVVASKQLNKAFFELGGRYDYLIQNAITISQTIPRELVRYNKNYHNFSASAGVDFSLLKTLNIGSNWGYATRNPAINELYSNGLHQGVSGIEEGNPNLDSEQSFKTTFSINGNLKQKLSFESLFYYQNIQDYIYLNPQEEIRLTIRGAFPVFKYEQTDAQIYGLDLLAHYQLLEPLSVKVVYSYIKGLDLQNDLALINMPSNNVSLGIKYEVPKWNKLENLEFIVLNKYVFMQNNLLASQDFALPPAAYYLLSLQASSDIQLSGIRLRIFGKIDNVTNTIYRDYLNRQRYFADDLGINMIVGVNIKF